MGLLCMTDMAVAADLSALAGGVGAARCNLPGFEAVGRDRAIAAAAHRIFVNPVGGGKAADDLRINPIARGAENGQPRRPVPPVIISERGKIGPNMFDDAAILHRHHHPARPDIHHHRRRNLPTADAGFGLMMVLWGGFLIMSQFFRSFVVNPAIPEAHRSIYGVCLLSWIALHVL